MGRGHGPGPGHKPPSRIPEQNRHVPRQQVYAFVDFQSFAVSYFARIRGCHFGSQHVNKSYVLLSTVARLSGCPLGEIQFHLNGLPITLEILITPWHVH